MLDKLVLIEGAYFYNRVKRISKTMVNDIFVEISKNRTGNYVEKLVKEKKIIDGKDIVFSICMFKYEQLPTFLHSVSDRELKYAYALIVEYDDYVVISKKNVSGLEKLLKFRIESLDYGVISKLLVDDDTMFEKMTMNNMDVSDNVIRRINVEALNLKNSYSPFGANRAIINNMRIKEGEERYTLSLNTSRINKVSKKSDFTGFCQWIISIVEKLIGFVHHNNYLDHFAKPLSFEDNISILEPSNILMLVTELKTEDIVDGLYYMKGSKKREISLNRILDQLETVKPITKTVEGKKTYYNIDNKLDKSLRLKINSKSISIHSSKLSNIIILMSNGEEINLLHYLNKRHEFIICFDNIDIVYKNRKLFKDSQLLGNLDYFMSVFIEFPELASITSEKGKVKASSVKFDSDCLFGFVEEKLAVNDDYIICDDLGNEWADHISVRVGESINYFHSKHSNLTSGASSFHEVVSQAQKNIGNIFATQQDLERKKEKWKKKYNKDKVSSGIERTRKGDLSSFTGDFVCTSTTPNTRKCVYLVIDFISKNDLITEVNILKKGIGKPKNETIQILWLLSSLISSCQNSNVNVYITCQP
ncbi:hypothetical protein [Tindallia californiensis]|uniref:Sporadically distributed protein, TIGR04141 family n=1 Tax=Tindallia californiensis TaxID=159292 RepID=A0A1H3P5U8_9FIRM|nr:hypothetical protein [Tindallia californiensis]SDY96175.1 hypothetical protein SAMN05192546_10612 [Tindallia californiensis]